MTRASAGSGRRLATVLAVPCGLVAAGVSTAVTETHRPAPGVAPRAELPAAKPGGATAALESPRVAGRGLLRWFGLQVYEATLWMGAAGLDPATPHGSAFALELRYARAIDGAAIAETSVREIARIGHGSADQRASWLSAMRKLFPDVREGDRLAGVNRPGRGVAFFRNDEPIGEIDDPAFAAAFFAIWLDPRTAAPELRRALLAGATPGAASAGVRR